MSVHIIYRNFRGTARDRIQIEQAVAGALNDASHLLGDIKHGEWQVTIDEYLSAPVYSIKIRGPVLVSHILSIGEDINLELSRSLQAQA